MKKLIMFVIASLLVISATVSAHSPSGISMEYDLTEKSVKVNVMHTSKDITKHFVDEIILSVNGVKKISQETTVQTDDKSQQLIYVIPELKSGDKITVKAVCSKFGDLTKDLKVK
ncbi:MAG: hypothetical protein CVV21_01220 [Candidatus Goldiibacteriota bacterium HGW-Goldbacteria-1]|jgi:hypothetical protein|nr:MAG: hypothetical protein CVV21_01220 [Candidatus Goldiibacteriota bacterium HGW-Goldbacteria-1]